VSVLHTLNWVLCSLWTPRFNTHHNLISNHFKMALISAVSCYYYCSKGYKTERKPHTEVHTEHKHRVWVRNNITAFLGCRWVSLPNPDQKTNSTHSSDSRENTPWGRASPSEATTEVSDGNFMPSLICDIYKKYQHEFQEQLI